MNRTDNPVIKTRQCRCGWGEVWRGGLLNGWLCGSGSHTNAVVALLHWKGGVGASPLKKFGKVSISFILNPFFDCKIDDVYGIASDVGCY